MNQSRRAVAAVLLLLLVGAAVAVPGGRASAYQAATPTLGPLSVTLFADNCLASTVGGATPPDSGDVLMLRVPITPAGVNETSYRVVFRGTATHPTSGRISDIMWGGPNYIFRSGLGLGTWDDSFGAVYNTPPIAPGTTYHAPASVGLLRQVMANALGIPNNGTGTVTFRAQVFSADFSTFHGQVTQTVTIRNSARNACPRGSIDNAATPVLVTDRVHYTVGQNVLLEWSIIAGDDINGRTAWMDDAGSTTIDVIRLTGFPSANPETDFANGTVVHTMSTYTSRLVPTCTLATTCQATDERSSQQLWYSYLNGSGNPAYTFTSSISTTGYTNDAWYMIRMRPLNAGTASHPVRGPTWTYFTLGNAVNVPGSIGDRVWLDSDMDGVQDPGEAGINGARVELWRDLDGDGTYETFVGFQITSGDGAYLFTNVGAGSYRVVVVPTSVPSMTPTTANPIQLVLAPGQSRLDVDFGFVPTAVIGGWTWLVPLGLLAGAAALIRRRRAAQHEEGV